MPDASVALPDTALQLFTGKGGVGKSTVVAATGLRLARQGYRVVIVELGEQSAMAEIFGVQDVGHAPVELTTGVAATKIDFEASLAEYMLSRLKLRPLANAVAHNETLRRFFAAAPGVSEIVALHRIAQLAGTDSPYDRVLVDLESTGHALMFFELPRVFDSFLSDGPLRSVLDQAVALLQDAKRTCVHLVALPEELSSIETRLLHQELAAREGLHLGGLIVNRVPSSPLSDEELEVVRSAVAQGRLSDELRRDARLAIEVSLAARRARVLAYEMSDVISLPTTWIDTKATTGLELVNGVAADLTVS